MTEPAFSFLPRYDPGRKRVNLFVDHAQILQLAALRAGIWGTADVWRRVVG